MKNQIFRKRLGQALALTFVVGLSGFIFLIRDRAAELAVYGYPGIFVLSVLTSATVILPAPSLLIVFSMGAVFPPLGVALAAGFGAALGELSGYLAGFGGRAVIEDTRLYDRILAWMQTHERLSAWVILFLAFLPIPIFDLAGIAAGALRMPIPRFLPCTIIGKILKMLMVAYLGAAMFE